MTSSFLNSFIQKVRDLDLENQGINLTLKMTDERYKILVELKNDLLAFYIKHHNNFNCPEVLLFEDYFLTLDPMLRLALGQAGPSLTLSENSGAGLVRPRERLEVACILPSASYGPLSDFSQMGYLTQNTQGTIYKLKAYFTREIPRHKLFQYALNNHNKLLFTWVWHLENEGEAEFIVPWREVYNFLLPKCTNMILNRDSDIEELLLIAPMFGFHRVILK